MNYEIFNISIKFLLILAILFFVVFGYACIVWTEQDKRDPKTIFIGAMVSIFYTFKILLIGFFLILIFSIFLKAAGVGLL